MIFAFLSPESARIAIPVALVVAYACYHVWRWRTKHPKVRMDERSEPEVEPSPGREAASVRPPVVACADTLRAAAGDGAGEQTPPAPAAGEEDFRRARAMEHQEIPDYRIDGLYLDLLGESAKKGYAPAMVKLGEYAMRRGCDVEAYYWLWRAKRAGMEKLERPLLQVRSAWVNGGCRRERANEHEGFAHEQGTIGYALLCIDARHNVAAARERLAECAPDLLGAS